MTTSTVLIRPPCPPLLPGRSGRARSDRGTPFNQSRPALPIGFALQLSVFGRGARVKIVDERDIMADAPFVLNGHAHADEAVTGNLATVADLRAHPALRHPTHWAGWTLLQAGPLRYEDQLEASRPAGMAVPAPVSAPSAKSALATSMSGSQPYEKCSVQSSTAQTSETCSALPSAKEPATRSRRDQFSGRPRYLRCSAAGGHGPDGPVRPRWSR